MSKKEHKQSKMRSLFKGLRKSTTDLSEWSKNDEKLMKAVEAGDLTKIEHTLNKKTLNPTKLGPKGLSVFHVACSLGQLAVVEMLISHGSEVNVLSIQGNTSVQLAARDGWPQVLKRLIDAGGVIDHKDGLSMTALHHACLRSQVPCAQVLLQHGADPNSRDKTGKPPLFYGAYSGDIGVCKELLDKGANVNCHDEQQLTPLMAAAKKGNGPCCEFLLKKGADPNFCDVQGHDALSYALDAGHTHLQEVFSKAPTRASWDVVQDDTAVTQGGQVAPDEPVQEAVIEGDTDDVAEGVDKDNMVAKFVPESTPEILRKSEQTGQTENPEVIQILTEKRAKGDLDEATLAERAASPPQSVIDQRTLEAYKELEEENDHLNEDYQALTAQHRRLQDEYSTLKKQLSTPAPPATDPEEVQELERELSDLKSVLTEETDKNMKLVKRLKDVKRKYKPQGSPESAEDSWSDSDDELFEESSTLKRKSAVVDHKPQTLLLLQNQVAQLRQDNKQLRERMQEMTGSVSSLGSIEDGHGGSQNSQEVDRLKRKVEELEVDKQTLQKQIHENNVFPEDQQENMMVLEQENTQLHSEVKQLRTEVNLLKLSKDSSKDITLLNGDVREGHSDKVNNGETSESAITVEKYENVESSPSEELEQERKAIIKVNEALRTENQLLTEELETLRVTYNKLVIAGDNLQDMYDQMVLEKEQILEDLEKTSTSKQEIAKENEFLLADGNAMHDDIERLVQEVEQLQGQKQTISEENDSLKRQLSAVNVAGKASDLARIVEERDKLQERVGELEDLSEELKQNHDIVLEEVQSLQDALQRIEYERDQIQQEFDSLQDEFENIQGSHEGLQQDYTQLEQDFSDLLADKEKLEQDFMDVQTANVNVEHNNPELLEERDKFQQENTVLVMEKEQLDMTVNELSKSNALIQEELASLKKALKLNEIKGDKPGNTSDDSETSTLPSQKEKRDKTAVDTVVEKDRRIRSLQIQISRLQQQLAESDRHYRDVISTYRTHLLSAVQGHMDPDVKQALYNIIELRSTEQFC